VTVKTEQITCKICKKLRHPSSATSAASRLNALWPRRPAFFGQAQGKKRISIRMLVLAVLLSLLLSLLAALQYRWLGQLSHGEREQMKGILQTAAGRFSRDFDRELTDAYDAFRPDRAPADAAEGSNYAAQYVRWASATQFPGLIKDVWMAIGNKDSSLGLQRIVPAENGFKSFPWPSEMDRLRQRLEELNRSMRDERAAQPANRNGLSEGMRREMRSVDEELPALIIPILRPPMFSQDKPLSHDLPSGFIILRLDIAYIKEQMLPALIERDFPGGGGLNLQIAVVRRDDPKTVIFHAAFPAAGGNGGKQAVLSGRADLTLGLFGLHTGEFPLLRQNPPRATGAFPRSGMPPDVVSPAQNAFFTAEPPPPRFMTDSFRPRLPNDREGLWQIMIQHRAGSLEAAVAIARYRNLTISFGILLLLGGSVVMIVISTRRALGLAQQQVEFVAGVTHELRTPIAVICLAGENLADRVILDRAQIAHYGTLIRDESRRLADTIEQMLEFAGAHSRYKRDEFHPLQVTSAIENAISDSNPLIQKQGFEIEQEIQSDLPHVMGNEVALRRALHNILNNAMKYSGSSRWIGLQAGTCSCDMGKALKISIQDRGLGISPQERARIFDPFFRGKEAVAAQIHGNGLGLSLVQRIVEAHGGKICVNSMMGQGSTFSIVLPIVKDEDVHKELKQ
jgi:signal transduction histidine kinase